MKQFFFRWLVALLVAPGLTYAQAQPAAMQKAVAGLIQQKAVQRGFAANDPRINATLQAGGSAIAGAAAAAAVVSLAGVTAPAWITAAVVMGLGTVFATGISLAIDKIKAWSFNSDGSIKVQVTDGGQAQVDYGWPVVPISPNDAATCVNTSIYNHCSPDAPSFQGCLPPGAQNPTNFCRPGWNSVVSTTFEEAMSRAGYTYRTISAPGETQTKTATDAVAALTDEQKAAPLNPELLAAIADQAWKQAATQPGYEGLPYDSSNPISSGDATSYQASNPSGYPTVGDAVAPQPAHSGGTAPSPWVLPAPSTSPGGDTAGETPTEPPQPTIDWTIGGSGETVPGSQVPIAYTPTFFASATGCPAPISFALMGKPYTISYGPFCDLMATLAPLFLACGAAAAALIFAESLRS